MRSGLRVGYEKELSERARHYKRTLVTIDINRKYADDSVKGLGRITLQSCAITPDIEKRLTELFHEILKTDDPVVS